MRWFTRIAPFVVCAVLGSTPVYAQINLNLQDAQVSELIKILSAATGKTFIPHPGLASLKVNIVTPGEVSLDKAYRIFQAYLRLQGFTTVEDGEVVKIVPLTDVKAEATRVFIQGQQGRAAGDDFVTQVIFLRYAKADELANALRPMVSISGLIISEPSSNSILITDTGDNVRRFLRIVQALDVEGSRRQVEVFALRYANAEVLAETLAPILEKETRPEGVSYAPATPQGPGGAISAGGAPTPPLAIVPEPRTNTLVAFGTGEQIGLLATLISKLDLPGTIERTTLHVYRLKHANAKELAEILTAQVRESEPLDSEERDYRPEELVNGVAPAPATAPASVPTTVVGQFESKVTVTADPSTNSLVIAAIPEDYRVLENVIDQLDERRTEVFVEALILEATTGAAQKIGVELRFPLDPNDMSLQPIGGTTFPVGTDPSVIGQTGQSPLTPPGGLIVGAIEGTIEFNGREFLNLAGLVRALQSDSNFNVLSTPHTTTLDNQEAEVIVGQERPFLRSQQSTDVGTLVSTFDFKDIGIKLRVTPHVGVAETVRLDLYVEITNFLAEAQNTVGAVTTTKRSVRTSVLVDSGQMAVIGGLMQDQQNNATARVPCLGSLPLAGWLFKSSSQDRNKTNLLIFIQPRILDSKEDLEELRKAKSDEYENVKPREKSLGEDIKDIFEQLEQRPSE